MTSSTTGLYTTGFVAEDGRITGLCLRKLHLTSLPDSVAELRTLRTLFLRDNLLVKILDCVFELENLDVFNNQITVISEDIGRLRNLWRAHLSVNQFEHIPDSVKKLEKLERLGLMDVQLEPLT